MSSVRASLTLHSEVLPPLWPWAGCAVMGLGRDKCPSEGSVGFKQWFVIWGECCGSVRGEIKTRTCSLMLPGFTGLTGLLCVLSAFTHCTLTVNYRPNKWTSSLDLVFMDFLRYWAVAQFRETLACQLIIFFIVSSPHRYIRHEKISCRDEIFVRRELTLYWKQSVSVFSQTLHIKGAFRKALYYTTLNLKSIHKNLSEVCDIVLQSSCDTWNGLCLYIVCLYKAFSLQGDQ